MEGKKIPPPPIHLNFKYKLRPGIERDKTIENNYDKEHYSLSRKKVMVEKIKHYKIV